VYIQSTYAMK